MLGGRDPVGVDRLDVVGVGLAAPADQEALGDRVGLVDLAPAGPAGGRAPRADCATKRQRHDRGAGEVVARLLVGDVDQRLEAPLGRRASPARPARRRAGRRSGSCSGCGSAGGRPGSKRRRRRAGPRPSRRAPGRRGPRCRRRGSAARRPPCRARRSRWRRRRRPRGPTGRRSWRSGSSHAASANAYAVVRVGCPRPDTDAADLMFTPVGELAARVRGGELSARELVQASLDRIEALDPRAQRVRRRRRRRRARRGRRRSQPGDERPFAGVPIAIKNNRAGRGPAHDLRRRSSSATSAAGRPQRYLVRACEARLRDRRHDDTAGVRDPADHRAARARRRPATRGTPTRTPGGSSRRLGGRGRRGHGPDRPRQRRRRLDPDPGRLLRPGRPQAAARARLARARTSATPSSSPTAC